MAHITTGATFECLTPNLVALLAESGTGFLDFSARAKATIASYTTPVQNPALYVTFAYTVRYVRHLKATDTWI